MLSEHNKTQKIPAYSIIDGLNQLASNNWSAFSIFFIMLLAAYLPALHAYYLHTDDYFWSYWGGFSNKSTLIFTSTIGRPLEGVLLCGLKLFKHLKALNIVRFLSVINLSCLALMISMWLRMNKVNALYSLLLALMITTLPPFQVYVAYISTATDGLSATLAMLALLLTHRSETATSGKKMGLLVCSVLLLIASLTLYQLSAFYYWAMVSVLALTTDTEFFIQTCWKRISSYFVIFSIAVVLYYAGWRLGLWYFDVSLGGKYDGRVFMHDPMNRLNWFFADPLFEASNLWNINPTYKITCLVGLLTALATTSGFFLKNYFSEKTSVLDLYNLIIKIALLLSFFPAVFIAALVSSEPSAEYRTYLCLSSIFIIYSFFGLHQLCYGIRKQQTATIFLLTLLSCTTIYGIYIANNIVTNYFVFPDSLELRYVQNAVNNYQHTNQHSLTGINIVIGAKTLAPQQHHEIGEASLHHGPNIRPMVETALSDLRIKNIRVSYALHTNDPHWTEHVKNLIGMQLPSNNIPADHTSSAIIDMSKLN